MFLMFSIIAWGLCALLGQDVVFFQAEANAELYIMPDLGTLQIRSWNLTCQLWATSRPHVAAWITQQHARTNLQAVLKQTGTMSKPGMRWTQ